MTTMRVVGECFLLVPAHPGCPGQIPQSRKTVVCCVCVCESMHLFTQSLSYFRNTYHRNLFCCSTEIMSSIPSLSLNPLLGTLSCSFTPLHIHLTILISARWSATSFSFLTGQLSLPCNILLRTQPLHNLPLTFNDISLLASNGTNCLNLFHPIQILFSTAASASPSTLNMSPK